MTIGLRKKCMCLPLSPKARGAPNLKFGGPASGFFFTGVSCFFAHISYKITFLFTGGVNKKPRLLSQFVRPETQIACSSENLTNPVQKGF